MDVESFMFEDAIPVREDGGVYKAMVAHGAHCHCIRLPGSTPGVAT